MAVDVPLTFIKLAALTGMSFVWANFTVKAFKLGWHIATFSLEKKEDLWIKEIVMCEECQKHFLDDGKTENFYVKIAAKAIENNIFLFIYHV